MQCMPAQLCVPNRGVHQLFSTCPSVAVLGDLWQGHAVVGMLTGPYAHSRRWKSRDCTAGLASDTAGSQEGNCADAQEGNWEPLSRLPSSLTVLSTQRCVVHAQCLLALRKFSFVAARLKTGLLLLYGIMFL